MPKERILTLSALVAFCKQNKIQTFSSSKSGKPIACVVNTFAELGKHNTTFEDQTETPGLLYKTVKVCHLLENRNGSFISEDSMRKAMPSLKNRPVLAYIHQLDDGTWDFYAHNMEIVENEEGDYSLEYTEKQVGAFTSDDPQLYHDDEYDKTYVVSTIAIPTDYTRAAQIIDEKGGTCKVSCELIINEMHYDEDEDYLQLDDFYFNGVTLLGCDEDGVPIEEGMEGSQIVTEDVASELTPQLFESMRKGGDNHMFEELLTRYNVTAEQVTFDYENMTDEELEAKFAEVFGSDEPEQIDEPEQTEESEPEADAESADESFESESQPEAEEDSEDDTQEDEPAPETYAVNISFELSYSDVMSQIYRALEQMDRQNGYNTCYDVRDVFDDHFIYMDYYNPAKIMMAQNYTRNDTEVILDGEPYQVFAEYLTADEKNELTMMRASYQELKEFKDNADAAALEAACQEVLNDESYAAIADDEAFVNLVENHSEFSAEDLRNRADLILAAHVRKVGAYSIQKKESGEDTTMTIKKSFNVNNSSTKDDNPYPGLFEDED